MCSPSLPPRRKVDRCVARGGPGSSNIWPQSHSGTIVTWDYTRHCQPGETAVIGYFYLGAYSPDVFRIVRAPRDNLAAIVDCTIDLAEFTPTDLGFASFSASGHSGGCNPCLLDCTAATAVRMTTWSAIKRMYGETPDPR